MYSDEYKKYLKKNKINNYLIKFTQISILVLLLLLWEYLARNNIINSFISSSPSRVIKAIINLYKQNNTYIISLFSYNSLTDKNIYKLF